MNKIQKLATRVAIGGIAGVPLAKTYGQSADSLIDKLVEKGVLTVKEGNEMREEADKNFTQSYAVKTGLRTY